LASALRRCFFSLLLSAFSPDIERRKTHPIAVIANPAAQTIQAADAVRVFVIEDIEIVI
jgi:hypothetical protein